jgi:hypothetical protein
MSMHRRRAGALLGFGLVVVAATAALTAGASAAGSSDLPLTTVVAATGEPAIDADSATAGALEAAINTVWPGSSISSITTVQDRIRDYVNAVGTLSDGSAFNLTVYRRFLRSELDGAGLRRIPMPIGTAWVGATDADLTSVYFLGSDGIGLYVGLQPAPSGTPVAVTTVAAAVTSFATNASIAQISVGRY